MALHPYIVDDGNVDVLLVWAERSTSALKIARDEHGPATDREGEQTRAPYEAEVTKIELPGVEAPPTAGLETRFEVLSQAELTLSLMEVFKNC